MVARSLDPESRFTVGLMGSAGGKELRRAMARADQLGGDVRQLRRTGVRNRLMQICGMIDRQECVRCFDLLTRWVGDIYRLRATVTQFGTSKLAWRLGRAYLIRAGEANVHMQS